MRSTVSRWYSFGAALLWLGMINAAGAADLTMVSPISPTVLMLYFDEGYTEFGHPDNGWNDKRIASALNRDQADLSGSYSITSSDDSQYSSATKPLQVSRKAKVQEATSAGVIWEHYVYLILPKALASGKTYTVSVGELADNFDDTTFTFDEFRTRSEAIHVNHVGYVPSSGMKYAYLSQWMGKGGGVSYDDYQGATFHVADAQTRESKFTGTIQKRKDFETGGPDNGFDGQDGPNNNYVGADVWVCDFSDFATEGEYVVVVEGIGCSFPFSIWTDVYRQAFYVTTRGLYHNRCGIALEEPYTDWVKPRCHHTDDNTTVFQSTWRRYADGDEHSGAFEKLPENATDEEVPYWGGWHDAADWDKGVRHLDASCELLLVYDLFPDKFADGELDIPESGNGIPDIIDEAKWNVDLYKRMQKTDGSVCGGLEQTRHPHKGEASDKDTIQWYAYGPDAAASYKYTYAACALAHCLEKAGKADMVDEYISSAKNAFDWAEANPDPGVTSVSNCGTDEKCRRYEQIRLRALAWLYRVTGDDTYQQEFKTAQHITKATDWLYKHQKYRQVRASFTYALTEQSNVDQTLRQLLEDAVVNWARIDRIETADKRSFSIGYHWWQPTLMGCATSPDIEPLLVAYKITGEQKYLDYFYATCDYFLGANQLNLCWVTGLGDRSPNIGQIMDLDSWYYYNVNKRVKPGIVPYGPNVWEYTRQCEPTFDQWPSHERWFGNRRNPATNEWTVWQTISRSAAAYGAACAAYGTSPADPRRAVARSRTLSGMSVVRTGRGLMLQFGTDTRYELKMIDMRGATVITRRGTASTVWLDTRPYAPGTYLWSVRRRGQTMEGRLTVMR